MSNEKLPQGKLIVIEGCDGAGGETQINLLKKKIPSSLFLHYPNYDNKIGEIIHRFLHKEFELDVNTQFLLYTSDMIKDMPAIRNALKEGRNVIIDRYFISPIVYQGLQGFPLEKALKFAEMFGVVKPDIVIFLKIRPETSIERKIGEKGENVDRWEKDVEWQKKVVERYEYLAKNNIFANKWFIIDGEKPIEEVNNEILKLIEKL